MAAAPFHPQSPLPVVLVYVKADIYEDEHHRLWRVANVEISSHCDSSGSCITVHLWQPSPHQRIPYNPMNEDSLPTVWILEARNTYRGTDSLQWRLLNHSQVDDSVQLTLMLV
ncbi:protein TCL1B1-like [Mus pahari]|uniref:protein TCL1B1-like n=1 Tax=Mus pahari TaxID=10093 RepID=UPI000A3044D6|nr:protein TCL1B1-like [Mus pahari]